MQQMEKANAANRCSQTRHVTLRPFAVHLHFECTVSFAVRFCFHICAHALTQGATVDFSGMNEIMSQDKNNKKKKMSSPSFFTLVGFRILTKATFSALGDEQRNHLVS